MDYSFDIEQQEIIYQDRFNDLLKYGTDLGVSDFFIASQRQIKGELHGKNEFFTSFDLTRTYVNQIAEIIYGSSGVSSKLVGEGIPCSYQFKIGKGTYRFRVNMMKSIKGIFIVMRPLDAIPPKLSAIGMESDIVNAFVSMCDQRSENTTGKLLIFAGETGSGKSSSIAGLIRYLIEESSAKDVGLNVYSAEAPVEYLYDQVNDDISVIEQFEIYKGFSTFSGAIRDFMRMDPDIVLVGETRDYETLDSVLQASNTGHVAVTTIHANSIAQIVTRMIDLIPAKLRTDGEIKRVLESFGLAVFQKLVPRKIKDIANKKGGRVAIREYLIFTKSVQSYLIANIDTLSQAVEYCVTKNGRSFEQHQKELVEKGIIDG